MMNDLKNLFAALLLLGAGLAGGYFLSQHLGPATDGESRTASSTSADEAQELWTCGMHPHVLEEEEGFCPICEMALVPLEMEDFSAGSSGSGGGSSSETAAQWACPDHPSMVEDGPGECPIDGLELVLSAPAEPEPQAAVVRVEPTVAQKMNVRTRRVERLDLSRPIRTVGYLDYDQERMVTVTTKYSGFVEKVHVNYMGEQVREGQPLFDVYSPELVQTEQELLSALRFVESMRAAPEDARHRAEALVDAARTRLGYWDISAEQIRLLEETGEVFRTLTVTSPARGVVMKRMPGLEGMAVKPGMEIFHIADLRTIWLSVEIYEDQIAAVREGSEAEISLSYFPGKTFTGTVRYLEPEFSEKTRTLRANIRIPNPKRELRKGMYATVTFSSPVVEDALVVPAQSVLRTGERSVVVVALGDGRFVPREVLLGAETGDLVQILEGVEENDEIVTSAQFLLDSESSLREAVRAMIDAKRASPASTSQPAATAHVH